MGKTSLSFLRVPPCSFFPNQMERFSNVGYSVQENLCVNRGLGKAWRFIRLGNASFEDAHCAEFIVTLCADRFWRFLAEFVKVAD